MNRSLMLLTVAYAWCCSLLGAVPRSQPLERITAAVSSGDYKQITSVVAASGDRSVYEHYFDEAGAGGLRNTRSATKTVTGFLIGAALDRRRKPPRAKNRRLRQRSP